MIRKILAFSKRPKDEQDWMTRNTWCELCQEADLGLIEPIEYEESGTVFLEGKCRKCGQKVFAEISFMDR